VELKPVLSLWAQKLSQRKLKKAQKVGYGGVFEAKEQMIVSTYDIGYGDGAKEQMIVSTYDIGYGDGFFRYDGLGDLKVAGGKNILGRVSMDSMSLQSSKNELCLFKDATNLAKYFNTITYEIITNLSPNIKRVVI